MAPKREPSLVTTLFAANDALWTFLACFLIATVILITQINAKKTASENESRQTGAAEVYIFWTPGIDVDIDTYVQSPDGEVVYFGHPNGESGIWNLLRDDLGRAKDGADLNFENASARTLPAGDYTVNVHAYRGVATDFPVTVQAEIRIWQGSQLAPQSAVTYRATVVLEHVRDEKTIIRFRIDENANLIPGSVNKVFKQLVKQK